MAKGEGRLQLELSDRRHLRFIIFRVISARHQLNILLRLHSNKIPKLLHFTLPLPLP